MSRVSRMRVSRMIALMAFAGMFLSYGSSAQVAGVGNVGGPELKAFTQLAARFASSRRKPDLSELRPGERWRCVGYRDEGSQVERFFVNKLRKALTFRFYDYGKAGTLDSEIYAKDTVIFVQLPGQRLGKGGFPFDLLEYKSPGELESHWSQRFVSEAAIRVETTPRRTRVLIRKITYSMKHIRVDGGVISKRDGIQSTEYFDCALIP